MPCCHGNVEFEHTRVLGCYICANLIGNFPVGSRVAAIFWVGTPDCFLLVAVFRGLVI